jgi:hypothetical protein
VFCAPVCVADEFVESDVLVCVLDALVDGVAVDVLCNNFCPCLHGGQDVHTFLNANLSLKW